MKLNIFFLVILTVFFCLQVTDEAQKQKKETDSRSNID